ncbi:hypothetical protein LJC68_09945 [Bacteroidales bacterium OttesenSCG-928-B11]|nr:hypothetical protein [Bacteroidales bacterium OttesenSCG-928-E04]MDL2313181.1 hypothetical protein [Bacteroidales bacterium OttesenSCG-928-B11]MDL2326632.1 hypothetical protein [Bacteroidales bacterium OttesenSCG-928-A14]
MKDILLFLTFLLALTCCYANGGCDAAYPDQISNIAPVQENTEYCYFSESTLPANALERPASYVNTLVSARQVSFSLIFREMKQAMVTKNQTIHTTFNFRHFSSLRSRYGFFVFGLMKIRI